MYCMKNNGSALLRESDTTFNNFPFGLSVLIVDHDQQSLQEMEANLRRCEYEVTKCVRVEDASTLLRMEGSVFHIIIIEQCLLGVNEYELLRIGREMDLPVIVTIEDGQPNIVQWSLENGTCEYRLKPIPMSVLNMVSTCMFFKKDNKWTQVQQPSNNARNQRMSWTPDSHEKFVESVQKLGGAAKATPKEILQFLQSNFNGFEDVDREKIASHLQKYREKLNIKKKYRESRKKTNLPTIGGSTSCGNQSNATQMDEAFSSEQMRNEFTGGQPSVYKSYLNDLDEFSSLDTLQGGISGDPGFFSINAPLLSPPHIDHGEHGFSLDGIFENFTGDVIAREHFNNL